MSDEKPSPDEDGEGQPEEVDPLEPETRAEIDRLRAFTERDIKGYIGPLSPGGDPLAPSAGFVIVGNSGTPAQQLARAHVKAQLALLDRIAFLARAADSDALETLADAYLTLPSLGEDRDALEAALEDPREDTTHES